MRSPQVYYHLDVVPQLSARSVACQGWVFAPDEFDLQVELLSHQQCLASFCCDIPRYDVAQAHAGAREALLSGFGLKLEFDSTYLGELVQSKFHLRVRSQSGWSKNIWSGYLNLTQPTVDISKSLSSTIYKEALDDGEIMEIRSRVLPRISKLHVVVYDVNNPWQLRGTLASLEATLLERKMCLDGQIVIYPQKGKFDSSWAAWQSELSSLTFVDRCHLRDLGDASGQHVLHGVEVRDLAQCFKSAADSEAFLFVNGGADLSSTDIVSMLDNYGVHPQLKILSCQDYGLAGGLVGPIGLDLGDFQKRTKVCGTDLPLLFKADSPDSVWLSSLEVLRELERKSAVDSRPSLDRSHGVSAHLDLRNPVYQKRGVSALSSSQKAERAQILASFLCTVPADRGCRAARTLFILPTRQQQFERERQSRRFLASLEKVFELEDGGISFLEDSDKVGGYWDGRRILSFDEYVLLRKSFMPERIVVFDALSMAAARVISHFSGAVVYYAVQQLDHLRCQLDCPERSEKSLWALQSDCVKIFESAWVKSKVAAETGACDGVLVSPWPRILDSQQDRQSPGREDRDICCIVLDSSVPEQVQLRWLSIAQELRPEQPVRLHVMLLDALVKPVQQLQNFAEQVVEIEDETDLMSRLYSSRLVLDLRQFLAFESLPAEARAAGALYIAPYCELSSEYPEGTLKTLSEVSDVDTVSGIIELLRGKAITLRGDHRKKVVSQSDCNLPDQTLISSLERATSAMNSRLELERAAVRNTSVIMPVFGALDITALALQEALSQLGQADQLIVVNDCSDEVTSNYLRDFTGQSDQVQLVEMERNQGFVQACLAGYNIAHAANDVVLLNSDVVLGKASLAKVKAAAYAGPKTAIASSLSTNSPHLRVDINLGDSLRSAGDKLSLISDKYYPTVITPEGQFIYLRRWALDKFGFLDEVFGRGFCEESDLCMRMYLMGADMVVASDSLIFHKRSASFGLGTRSQQIRRNRPIFDSRYRNYYQPLYESFLATNPLCEVRERYAECGNLPVKANAKAAEPVDVSFRPNIAKPKEKVEFDAVQICVLCDDLRQDAESLAVLEQVNLLLTGGIEARIVSLGDISIGNYPLLSPVLPIDHVDLSHAFAVCDSWLACGKKAVQFLNDQEQFLARERVGWLIFASQLASNASMIQGGDCATSPRRKVLVEGERAGLALSDMGCGEVQVFPTSLDQTRFFPGEQAEHHGPTRVTLCLTDADKRFALEEFLRHLTPRLSSVAITVVGLTGPLGGDLSRSVELSDISAPGEQSRLYRASDIVVEFGCTSSPGVQAMACGAVAVVSSECSIFDWCKPGVNCVVSDLHDPVRLTDSVIRLVCDRTLREEFRQKGISSAQEFSLAASHQVFKELLGLG